MKVEIDDKHNRIIVDDTYCIPYLILSFLTSPENRVLFSFGLDGKEVTIRAYNEEQLIWIEDSDLEKDKKDII
jgi:hypothetical protein